MESCPLKSTVVGNGSDELIELLSNAMRSVGENALLPIPSFVYLRHRITTSARESISSKSQSHFSIVLGGAARTLLRSSFERLFSRRAIRSARAPRGASRRRSRLE
jgi:histidinol-phosphate/aromatic aminotransferase/cobyric acid decarboxylase-like protein